VDYIPGIGHVKSRMLLEELNITIVKEIAEMDAGNLKLIFKNQAWVIHQRATGIDPTPVLPPSSEPEVSDAITLDRDINDDERLLSELYSLVERCAKRLRQRELRAGMAVLTIRYSDQMESTRKAHLATQGFWESELYPVIKTLFFRACERRCGVRFMRVRFTDLKKTAGQLSLFSIPRPEVVKKNKVSAVMDRIKEKYGEELVNYGKTIAYPQRHGGHRGCDCFNKAERHLLD
jgi:DNA polymerase IV